MSRRHHFREHLPLTPKHESSFRWRGREVSRLEGFSDAVFAFAVTLLVVALEVPRTFEGLMDDVREFPAFAVSFAMLLTFWNGHYRFFRRYGLEDGFTRYLTYGILLMVLFSVYPLKFLFSAWLGGGPHRSHLNSVTELRLVFQIYSGGFALLWGLYALLHWHALRKRHQLQLSATELVITWATFWKYVICIGVALLSVALASTPLSNSPTNSGIPGYVYGLLGPLLGLNGWWHGRHIRALRQENSSPDAA